MADDCEITADLLRRAGWDDRHGVFAPPGREGDYWLIVVAGRWMFTGRACDLAAVTTMADVARLRAAAESQLTPLED